MAKKKAARPKAVPPLIVTLKKAITASGRSYYELGRAAGVDPSVITRFMAAGDHLDRGGDIRLSTASRLAEELGMGLYKCQGTDVS